MRISDWSSDVCSSDLPTLENYQLASNGGTISTGSGFKAYDPTQDNSGATPTYTALIFDGFGPNSLKRRVFARRVLNVATVGRAYMKDSQLLFPVEFSCHYVSTRSEEHTSELQSLM